MKKTLLIICLSLFALTSYSQLLKPVALDSLVTVSLPEPYKKTDTLGQQLYSASASFGYIMVIRAVNPPDTKLLKKEKDLDKVFKEYVQKVQRSAVKGRVVDEKDTTINNLHIKDFNLETDTGTGVQIRKFRLLYTHKVIYTFEYLYDHTRAEVAAPEIKEFFGSIKISPQLEPTDQFTLAGQFTGMHKGLKIALIAGGVLIIGIIMYLIMRRKKKQAEDQ
jgi:hypothetical protein